MLVAVLTGRSIAEVGLAVSFARAEVKGRGSGLDGLTQSRLRRGWRETTPDRMCGLDAEVLHVHTIKPLDVDAMLKSVARTGAILTIEEQA